MRTAIACVGIGGPRAWAANCRRARPRSGLRAGPGSPGFASPASRFPGPGFLSTISNAPIGRDRLPPHAVRRPRAVCFGDRRDQRNNEACRRRAWWVANLRPLYYAAADTASIRRPPSPRGPTILVSVLSWMPDPLHLGKPLTVHEIPQALASKRKGSFSQYPGQLIRSTRLYISVLAFCACRYTTATSKASSTAPNARSCADGSRTK